MLSYREILNKLSWSSVSSIIFLLIQTIVFLYVTYIIDTSDIGVYSIITASILIGVGIIENSFVNSLIHSNTQDPEDFDAVLTINNCFAIFFSVIISILSVIFFIFKNHILYISGVMFLLPCFFFAAFNKTQIAGLQNKLNFKEIAYLDFWSSLIYITVLLITTFLNLGIWILLIAFLTKYLSAFLIIKQRGLQVSTRNLNFKNKKIKPHWQYGKYIFGEKVLTGMITYADTFIVSITLGLSTLGVYEIFKRIIISPITIFYGAVEQLFFPLMVKSNTNKVEYKKVYAQLTFFSKHLFINITCILYVQSDLILSFFPTAYHQGDVLRAICLFACVIVIVNPIDIILYSKGKSRAFFKWILSYAVPLIIIIFYSSTWGLTYMINTISLFYVALYVLSYFVLIKKEFGITFLSYNAVLIYSLILFAIVTQVILMFDHNIIINGLLTIVLLLSMIFHVLNKKTSNNPLI